MADLDSLQASQSVKIAGASSSGAETNYVNATANGDLKSADILNTNVAEILLSVSTTLAIEVKAGLSRLANRKTVQIQAQGSNVVYGFNSTTQIFTIANGDTVVLSVGDGIGVWVKRNAGIGSVNVAIAEFS